MTTQNIRFGELETKALFALEEAEARVITSSELGRMLKLSKNRTNKLVWQLVRKKRLIRIRRGIYLFAPLKAGPKGNWSEEAFVVLSELLKKDYYIGYWAALNQYGLTEQIPWVVQVVTTRRRRSFEAAGAKFEFIKVGKLGKWQEERIAGKNVRMGTVEQLIIDCLTHPEYCGGVKEAAKALWNARNKINWKMLRQLAVRSKDATKRRLGFLLELLGLPSLRLEREFIGWRWLDPSTAKTVKEKSVKWALILNLSKAELTAWKVS